MEESVATDLIVEPSPVQGPGVFAARDFAAGGVVLRIDDSRVVDDANPLRSDFGERGEHCDYLADGRVIFMKAPERYINSSCDPNTYVRTSGGVRMVLALRAIRSGEEITYDYLINCHGGVRWTCNCRSAGCRGEVPASFFDLPTKDQRRLVPLLDSWFVREHQEEIAELTLEKGDAV
jgi:SET domain-containing protein